MPESQGFIHEGKALHIRGLSIGSGLPKIIVPIVETTEEGIKTKAAELAQLDFDVVEWRADFFEALKDPAEVGALLHSLREILGDKLLLFTVRTSAEGGNITLSDEAYLRILKDAAETGACDLIDAEILKDEALIREVIDVCHHFRTAVVGSNHDFAKTPAKEELIRRLCLMREMGADILKIAVMPVSRADVLTLLQATLEADEAIPDRPLITMSMGGKGAVSRITGEIFGSSMTFGSVGTGSAPGQIPLEKLQAALTILHEAG